MQKRSTKVSLERDPAEKWSNLYPRFSKHSIPSLFDYRQIRDVQILWCMPTYHEISMVLPGELLRFDTHFGKLSSAGTSGLPRCSPHNALFHTF